MAGATKVGTSEGWSSRWAFILAAIGSAVGLGNLWRFPAEAGANGGGAFVIFYIICVVLIGLPVLLAESLIGRHGRSSAVESVKTVARESGASEHWSILATVGMLGAFVILTFYSVIAGWVIHYIIVFAGDFLASISNGNLTGGAFEGRSSEDVQAILPRLFADESTMLIMHAVFMAVTIFVVARGILGGIEKVAVWLMPSFFLLFLGITIYGSFTGDIGSALTFLFAFEPSRLLDPNVMLSALGQALFSLSLGSALMITYGAYADRSINLAGTSGMIATADTAVAIIAGLAIFPIVFAAGLDVASGPTLMFQTLPASFQAMPAGSLIGLLFFIMVFFAALTSSVALLEAPTSWAIHRFKTGRILTTTITGGIAFLIGIAATLSFNSQAEFYPLNFGIFANQNMFGFLDVLSGKILLPVSAFLVAVFVGWIADRKLINSENGLSGGMESLWRFLIAWLCPVVVGLILFFGLFPELLN